MNRGVSVSRWSCLVQRNVRLAHGDCVCQTTIKPYWQAELQKQSSCGDPSIAYQYLCYLYSAYCRISLLKKSETKSKATFASCVNRTMRPKAAPYSLLRQ
jgi:hypothetical protein